MYMENTKNYITKEVIEECLVECLEEIETPKKENVNKDNSKKEN